MHKSSKIYIEKLRKEIGEVEEAKEVEEEKEVEEAKEVEDGCWKNKNFDI